METDHHNKKYDLIETFKDFTDGVRVLFLLQRSKEGGETNNTKVRKIVTTNQEEYAEALCGLLAMQYEARLDGKKLRIYASVNKRDINKAIREFKYRQLDADYYDPESRDSFYYDIKNRFISTLMAPKARAETQFLIDIDNQTPETLREVCKVIDTLGASIIKRYDTKSGVHLITTPFNPKELEGIEDVSVNKDGLLLLSFY